MLAPKIQLILAALASLAICLFSYADALNVGFLLDDFLHLDYIKRALHGDWHDFLHNFYGNWANSPIMQSFRPLVSLSLFFDYCIFGANAWGFHFVNLLMLWGCSVFVGLISLELSGLRGNRLGGAAALWAVLLFAVYPLHLEAAVWIIGRVDLLCTLFYLASVFCYLRFRVLREKLLFYLAIVSFTGAFFSKEMAVTLPAVITAAELLLFPLFRDKVSPEFAPRRKTWRLVCILSFWAVFGLLFFLRLFALGTVVGGYGVPTPSLQETLARFTDRGTLERIFFPVNLDILSRTGEWSQKESLVLLSKIAFQIIISSALLRLVALNSISLRIVGFLVFWVLITLLPTYQIWLIFPNLVGSRLFFLSSAPFAILLAFLALPAIDVIKASHAKIFSVLGSLGLLLLVCIWSYWLQVDLKAWTGAAAVLQSFKKQAIENFSQVKGKILFLNIPSDYSGAGMLTRADYLRFLFATGNPNDNIAKRILTAEPADKQTHFDFSKAIAAAVTDKSIARMLLWNPPKGISETGAFTIWSAADSTDAIGSIKIQANEFRLQELSEQEGNSFQELAAAKLQVLSASKPNEWTVEEAGRSVRLSKDGICIKPGKHSLNLVFCTPTISTLNSRQAELQARVKSGPAIQASVLWSSADPKSELIEFKTQPISIPSTDPNRQTIELGENRDWALTGKVNWIGIHLPKGDYEIELSSLALH